MPVCFELNYNKRFYTKLTHILLIHRKPTINDAKEIMDLINEAYNTNGSEKWIKRDLCPRIGSLEQVVEMIPNAYITRHDASKEITGVVVAELDHDDDVVNIGPFATRPKFQVVILYYLVIGLVIYKYLLIYRSTCFHF